MVNTHLRGKAERGLRGALEDDALLSHGHLPGLHELFGAGEPPSDAPLSLWWATLDLSTTALKRFAVCLSPEERQRAERFRRSLDRERFVAAKGWMRYLLASLLSCAMSDIVIVADEDGKPRLASTGLSFSASRTGNVALYATSWRMKVGVDIEAIRPGTDIHGMTARFMSPAEQRALASLAPARHRQAFFQCWTRKEAYLKGIGVGLNFPLRNLDVWDGTDRPATVSGWSVHQVDLGPGFAGAVAGANAGGWAPPVPQVLGAINVGDSDQLSPGGLRATPGHQGVRM
jgi:4'-phosphopantetheinyl transferase